MEKTILVITFLLFAAGLIIFKNSRPEEVHKISNNVKPTTSQVLSSSSKEQKSLFVPYWALTQDKIPSENYDQFIYFGIAVTLEGIDKNEQGYNGLERFAKTVDSSKETLLTIRMLNPDTNFAVLKDKTLQQKIISQTIATAKEYNFKGIVLDLEVSSLPFSSITTQMDSFVQDLHESVKKENLSFSLLLFGDTFYRIRPYDVASLVTKTDKIMVMAYDFHKAKQDPGPNFPLHGKETYGYDLTSMTNDFLNIVPKEKLVIVFGMFGYDWSVDANGKSTKQASSMSFYQIKEKFLTNCQFKNCVAKRDVISAETKVTYVDVDGKNHVVWFEDEESVAKKEAFLKEKGINAVGFWAYSYF